MNTQWENSDRRFVRTKECILPCGIPVHVVIEGVAKGSLGGYYWTMTVPTECLFLESSTGSFSKITDAQSDADERLQSIFSFSLVKMKQYIESFRNKAESSEEDDYERLDKKDLIKHLRISDRLFYLYKKKMLALMYSYEMLICQVEVKLPNDISIIDSVVDEVDSFHGAMKMPW